MCNLQRLRPACPYTQSDQSLCLSLEYSVNIKLLTEHHLESLNFKRFCTGSSESKLVKMPHCWKSHVATHLSFITSFFFYLQAKVKLIQEKFGELNLQALENIDTMQVSTILIPASY